MFSIFSKKSKLEKLQIKYKKLLEKSHAMSKINRAEGDRLYYEANEILKEIEDLKRIEN